jgi:subtilisin family serine protease
MRGLLRSTLLVSLCSLLVLPASAQDVSTPVDVSQLLVPDGRMTVTVQPQLARAMGKVKVVVRLLDASLVEAAGKNAKQKGSQLNPAEQRKHLERLAQQQSELSGQIQALGGREIGRMSKTLNAVIVAIDASQLGAVAALPQVHTIRPLRDYELDLGATVAHIGADIVQAAGFDGAGVRVAVLDSGIDYTHRNLGGPGTSAAYKAAYGESTDDPKNTRRDGLFPTAKVVGGYDFVGEHWPDADPACPPDSNGKPTSCLRPDDDPIDCGPAAIDCDGGHGTHVSDIIAGHSADGTHKGVAPGASLYALKVCSSVATSCSGLALLQAMDFALDPNGDGDMSDAVDVIHMSLGSSYGQREDDLSQASANAVAFGVTVVASAGNSADRPYIVGSPSTTPEVLSVAATFHPTAKLYLITPTGTSQKGGIWQSWSADPSLKTGQLAFDNTNASTRRGCTDAAGGNPYTSGSHAGKILLMDRGVCAVSLKVSNAAAAGAIAAIVANNVSQPTCDLPPTFSFGGGTPSISGYSITQADGNDLKALALGRPATIDPANSASLVGNMAAFSSRGPSYSYNAIKPDLGAIGTDIISANAGSGSGESSFAGTSASAPVASGTVAQLIHAYPTRSPGEIKALLMNTAERAIGLNPIACPGVGAPITRIGGGEVRVNRALDSKTAAWDAESLAGSLSFGYDALTELKAFNKTIVVRNYGNTARTYSITRTFRYPSDAASGAVTLETPPSIRVPANGSATFKAKLKVDVTKLPVWNLNGGSRGGDGFRLQDFEFDGYLNISDATDNVHLAWHILPHRAAAVTPATNEAVLAGGTTTVQLSNTDGAVDGRVDVFSLLGTSGKIQKKFLPGPGDNFAVVDLKSVGARLVGIGGGNFGIQFSINTFGERAHPNYPAEFDIYIDANRDGTADAVIFNVENGGFAVTGQNVVAAGPLPAGPFVVSFFSDADLNSGNIILTAPLSALGLTPGTQFDFSVFAFDNYFTGALTDAIVGKTYTAGTPRYAGSGIPPGGVPAGGSSTLTINAVPGGSAASPSQTGLLLMYRDGRPKHEADAIAVSP